MAGWTQKALVLALALAQARWDAWELALATLALATPGKLALAPLRRWRAGRRKTPGLAVVPLRRWRAGQRTTPGLAVAPLCRWRVGRTWCRG